MGYYTFSDRTFVKNEPWDEHKRRSVLPHLMEYLGIKHGREDKVGRHENGTFMGLFIPLWGLDEMKILSRLSVFVPTGTFDEGMLLNVSHRLL